MKRSRSGTDDGDEKEQKRRHIDAEIATLEQDVADLRSDVSKIRAKITAGEQFRDLLISKEKPKVWKSRLSEFPCLIGVIKANQSVKKNLEKLTKYLMDEETRLFKAKTWLENGKQRVENGKQRVENEKQRLKNEKQRLETLRIVIEEKKLKLSNDIEALNLQITEGKRFMEALQVSENKPLFLQTQVMEFPRLEGVIEAKKSPEANLEIVEKHLEKLKAALAEYKQNLARETTRHDYIIDKLLHLSPPGGKDTVLCPAQQGDSNSGLAYVHETHRIGIASGSSNHIGLVEVVDVSRKTFKTRHDLATAAPCAKLKEAWSLFSKSLTRDQFIDELVLLLPKLTAYCLKSAWLALNFHFKLRDTRYIGKMTLQQYIHSPFAALFMAAAGIEGCAEDTYRADQEVSSSLSVHCKSEEEDEGRANRITMKPDAAVTLSSGWDVFGMMEITPHDQCGQHAYLIANDKCALMTAVTAIAIKACIQPQQVREVALPFVIATGTRCSLYVTTFDEEGFPCIQVVGYPGGGTANEQDLSDSSSDERKKFFVALAVLLNRFKECFDDEGKKVYEEKLLSRIPSLNRLSRFSLTGKSKSERRSKKDADSNGSKTGSNPSGKSSEQLATDAASCGGIFSNVEYPFERFLRFTDEGCSLDKQTVSPYYFQGYLTSSTHGMTTKHVFLKVWNADDVKLSYVESEWMNHRHAFNAGVPVAAPVLPTIARSRTSCGSKYLVFAVEYADQERIEDAMNLLQFCDSLIETVMKLHNQANLLHCDLKPDNLRWSDGVVRLIDFEHSQCIDNAEWVPGTEGFEAPEILNHMPCSTETDAFSVGRIILTMLDGLLDKESSHQNHICLSLHDIAVKLTDSDSKLRWSLTQALHKIRNSNLLYESPPSKI